MSYLKHSISFSVVSALIQVSYGGSKQKLFDTDKNQYCTQSIAKKSPVH